jgi:nucleoside-diphosphate-sugar epimerase
MESQLDWIFLRPGYFMQNLTSEFLADICEGEIRLPAGSAKFNWVDAANVAEVAALVLADFPKLKNQALVITGEEQFDFRQATSILSEVLNRKVKYRSVSPFSFYFHKRAQKVPKDFIMVLIALHFFPRFQSTPLLSDTYPKMTGKSPTSLREFMEHHKKDFQV